MATPAPTIINLSDTSPAADSGFKNGLFRAGNAYSQVLNINGINTNCMVRDVSVEVRNLGSVNAQVGTSYTVTIADQGKLITFDNGSPVAVILPVGSALPQFFCMMRNLGAGQVTVAPASGTVDGAANFTLDQGQGVVVYSDGSNYFTMAGKGTGGPAASAFTDLTDVPNTYSGSSGFAVRVNNAESGLEFVTFPAGVTEFIGLTDVPNTYSGSSGLAVRVNNAESGLEFVSFPTGISEFIELTDVPNSYSGASLQLVRVNNAESALEFFAPDAAITTFLGLTDTPESYTNCAGKVVGVKQDETGLEFKDAAGTFYEIVVFYQGKPISGELLFRMKMARQVTFPASLTGSKSNAGVAPIGGDYIISLKKAGVQFATLTFATNATTGTYSLAADNVFSADDIFEITAPATIDANFQDLAVTLVLTV